VIVTLPACQVCAWHERLHPATEYRLLQADDGRWVWVFVCAGHAGVPVAW
jgi:hypothetical protein